jgi:hypothetical protein
MNGLHIQGEQRHPDVVHIRNGSSGTMFEYVADLEVLIVKTGCLTIAPRAGLAICG